MRSFTTQAQTVNSFMGTEFWITFPEPIVEPFADSLKLIIVPERDETIEVYNVSLLPKRLYFNVKKNIYNEILVGKSMCYARFKGQVKNQAIVLKSVNKSKFTTIAVHQITGSNAATVVLPSNLLEKGQEYVLHTYKGDGQGSNSGMNVVAMDTGKTLIEVRPNSFVYGGSGIGSVDTHTLKQGDVFTMYAADTHNLSGTTIRVIKSCKKVAVFSFVRCAVVSDKKTCGSCDLMWEQLKPKQYAGKQFVVWPIPDNTTQFLSILSLNANTNVKINGVNIPVLAKFKTFVTQQNCNLPISIESDKPISVLQITKSHGCNGASSANDGDPSMQFVSPIGGGALEMRFTVQQNPVISKHYLIVSGEGNAKPGFRINGVLSNPTVLPYSFYNFAGKNFWYAIFSIKEGSNYSLSCDTPFISTVFSQANSESQLYALTSNWQSSFADFTVTPVKTCYYEKPFVCNAFGDSVNTPRWFISDGSNYTGNPISHRFAQAGKYKIKMVTTYAGNFCKADTTTREIEIIPSTKVRLPADTTMCEESILYLRLPINQLLVYKWENGSANPTRSFGIAGTYSIQIRDTNGCIIKDTFIINTKDCGDQELLISNIFTPNGDGKNDLWEIKSINMKSIEVEIFNRWGQIIYSYSLPQDEHWNGKVNNLLAACPEGVYYYNIKATKERSGKVLNYHGVVQLLR